MRTAPLPAPTHLTGATAEPVVRLPDGGTVRYTALTPALAPDLAALLRALGTDDRRLRFFQAVPEVTPALVRQLCGADQVDHVAWLGYVDGQPAVEARMVRLRQDPSTADVAFAVHPDARGRGLASTSVRALGVVARTRGIRSVVGDALPENRGSVAVLRSLGLSISFEDGTLVGRGPVPPWTGRLAEAAALVGWAEPGATAPAAIAA